MGHTEWSRSINLLDLYQGDPFIPVAGRIAPGSPRMRRERKIAEDLVEPSTVDRTFHGIACGLLFTLPKTTHQAKHTRKANLLALVLLAELWLRLSSVWEQLAKHELQGSQLL